jgi:hemerythrin-like domain-containing protein
MEPERTRRAVLLTVASGVGLLVTAGIARAATRKKSGEPKDEEVSPAEDLMREHGVLRRLLLVYEEALRRLDGKGDFPADHVKDAAGIIRRFVEDYHEKLEEEFVFPRFEKAGKLVDLVTVLRTQHQAGRALTDRILRLTERTAMRDDTQRREMSDGLRGFIRLYRPHAAREDTVLFPAFRPLVGSRAYAELGERFEDREHELFGKEGFEGVVAQVAKIEQALGLYELAQFTPPTP